MTKLVRIFESIDIFLEEVLSNPALRKKYLLGCSFSRNRSLPLGTMVRYLLSLPKKSLSVNLSEFSLADGEKKSYTKGAFSQARYQISSDLFRDLHRFLVGQICTELGKKGKRWRGFRLKAVDGTTLDIPDTCDVWKHFGGITNQYGRKTMARAVVTFDLLNEVICESKIGAYKSDEFALSKDFLKYSLEDDLLIYDRKYGSFATFYKHFAAKRHFLIRIKNTLNHQTIGFLHSKSKDALVEMPITDAGFKRLKEEGFAVDKTTTVTVRLIKVKLPNDEIEILATNLLDKKKYARQHFKALYAKRWGVETAFDTMKNKLQTELFCGHKAQAIEQEFYANCMAFNLNAQIWKTAENAVELTNKEREKKGLSPQKINKNVAIGLTKLDIVELLTKPKKRNKILAQLVNKIAKNRIAPKPGRTFKRKFKTHRRRGKFRTMNNYRKAI